MRKTRQIILFGFLFGIVAYIMAAIIEWLFFSDKSFLDALLFDIFSREMYIRVSLIILLGIFLLILAYYYGKYATAKKNIRQRGSLFFMLAEQSPNAIFIFVNGRVVYASEKAGELTGYAREEFYSPDFDFLTLISPEFIPLVRANLQKHEQGLDIPPYEIRNVRKNGTEIEVIISTRLIDYAGDKAIMGTVTDISVLKKNQRELLQAKQRLTYLVEESPAIIYSCGPPPDYLTTFISENVIELMGYKPENFYNDDSFWMNRIHPDDRGLIEEEMKKLPSGKPISYDYRFRRDDGDYLWLHDKTIPSFDSEGNITGLLGSCFDISQKKLFEEKLRESQRMLQLVLDHIPQRVFWKDKNYGYLGCNNVFARDAGLESPEQIKGMEDFELSWKEVAHLYRNDDISVVEKGESKLDYEEPQVRGDLPDIWLRTTKLPLRNNSGEIIGVFGCYEDITERKEKEKELRQNRDLLLTLIDNSPGIIYIKDVEGRYMLVNKPMAEKTGFSREEIIGKTDYDFHSKEIADAFRHNDLEIVKCKKTMEFEEKAMLKNEPRTFLTIKAPLFDQDGNPYAICGLATDNTERKKSEEERKKLVEQLQKALDEVKTLSGFIPICSSCKNIRDDAGYWKKVEAYIAEHSNAKFSHGLCPDCARKLYPDIFKNDYL